MAPHVRHPQGLVCAYDIEDSSTSSSPHTYTHFYDLPEERDEPPQTVAAGLCVLGRAGPRAGTRAQVSPLYGNTCRSNSRMREQEPIADAHSMSEVLPTLVRWRLLVFYAPFYRTKDFHDIEEDWEDLDASTHVLSMRRANHAAEEVLTSITDKLSALNIPSTLRAYMKEHKRAQNRCNLNLPARYPVTQMIDGISLCTGISQDQLLRAMALYNKYLTLDLHDHGVLPDHLSLISRLTKLSAVDLGEYKNYETLARLVKSDLAAIDCYGIYPASGAKEAPPSLRSEQRMFYTAANRCFVRYFWSITYNKSQCGCSFNTRSRSTSRSHTKSNGSHRLKGTAIYFGIKTASIPLDLTFVFYNSSVRGRLNTLNSTLASFIYHLCGLHAKCQNRFESGTLTYKLSEKEKLTMVGDMSTDHVMEPGK